MRVTLAQLNYHIGNFEVNSQKIHDAILEAEAADSDLIIFGELAVCGYPPKDLLEFTDFNKHCNEVIEQIRLLKSNVAVIIGAPTQNPNSHGKDLYNSAYVIEDGKISHVVHKTLLPVYDIFDESRYFEPNTVFNTITIKGKKIALTICEDIWNTPLDDEFNLYKTAPLEKICDEDTNLIINISGSPFSAVHHENRKRILKANFNIYKKPIIYVNNVGAHTETVFDGGSMIINNEGDVGYLAPFFEESNETVHLAELKTKHEQSIDKTQLQHEALVLGVKDYFRKCGFKKAIIGLSGGIDSALVAQLACAALGAENVLCVLLPSRYSSDHSVSDALELVKNLGCKHEKISIEQPFKAFNETLAPVFEGLAEDVTEENLQARSRAVILMAISNKKGYILLNTSNKSEAAVGYGTLYGDMCGGLSVIGDLYKTEVFEMCRWINRDGEVIPENIITKPPSAELRPDQKDSDSLPDYEILDAILYQYIEKRQSASEIIAMGYEQALVTRILKMTHYNEWKRHQMAPVIRLSSKSFGFGRRMPIVAKYISD